MKSAPTEVLATAFLAFVCNAGPAASSDPCAIDEEIKSASLEMDYHTFDQSMTESPWRKLAENECFRSAAELIAYYIDNKGLPESHNLRGLRFHSGQLLALAGETEKAIEVFEKSRWPEQPPSWPIDMNTYITGTIAFLKKDQRTFDLALDTLTEGQKKEGRVDAANVAALTRLKECWSTDYYSAYAGEC